MIPQGFERRTVAIYRDEGRRWLRELPTRLDGLSRRWGIVIEAPFPDLSYNYVAPTTDAGGRRCVLKLGVGSPEGDREPVALAAYAGRRSVRLYRHDPSARAMLLERIEPGDDLREKSDPEAAEIASEVLRELWTAPPPEGLPGLEEWTASVERFVAEPGPLPPDLLNRAASLRRELLAGPPERVLLHGDLHHANLLRSEERGWLAIDPKGVLGEKAYDLVSFLLNPGPVSPETTRLRIETFVERLGLDRERVVAWAFVQSVVSACWTVEDGGELWEGALGFAEGLGYVL